MTCKKGAEIGKVFENLFKNTFSYVSAGVPCLVKKITDSRSAGNIIATVAGDFEVRVPTKTHGLSYNFLVECKASQVKVDFASSFRSFMSPKIFGRVRLEKRSGAIPLVLFYSTLREEIEVWDYMKIISQYPNKRVPLTGLPALIVAKANLRAFCHRWATKPEELAASLNFEIKDSLERQIADE
jgi:hypothetical protein